MGHRKTSKGKSENKNEHAQRIFDLKGGGARKHNVAGLIAVESQNNERAHSGGYFIGALLAVGVIIFGAMLIWAEPSGAGTSYNRSYYASSPSIVEMPNMPNAPQNRGGYEGGARTSGSLGGDVILPSDIMGADITGSDIIGEEIFDIENQVEPEIEQEQAIEQNIDLETMPIEDNSPVMLSNRASEIIDIEPEMETETEIGAEIGAEQDGDIEAIETAIYSPPSDLISHEQLDNNIENNQDIWQANAINFEPIEGRPLIAIVIDDLGNNPQSTRRTIALPSPLTLSFLPNVGPVQYLADEGLEAGHELLVHVPMEPMSATQNPGDNALLVSQSISTNIANLEMDMNSFKGHVGFNNHMGSRFTSDHRQMEAILEYAKSHGYMYMDSRTIGSSVGHEIAENLDMPRAVRDIFLDHEINEEFVRSQLRQLERTARRQGYAVAIGHPHDVTLRVLAEYLPSLEARGFQLAPITAIAKIELEESGHDMLLQAAVQ